VPRAPSDLAGSLGFERDSEQARRALEDAYEIGGRVELEARHVAEAIPQRRGEHAGARGGANQGEAREIEPYRARARPLSDHEVELEVLHGRVEDLFHGGAQTMDLVDEEHVAGLEVREQCRQIAGALDHGATGGAELRAHLVGDDARESSLAEAGRAVEKQVINGLPAAARRFEEHGQVLTQPRLPHELGQRAGPQALLDAALVGEGSRRERLTAQVYALHRELRRSAALRQLSRLAPGPSSAAVSSTRRCACARG